MCVPAQPTEGAVSGFERQGPTEMRSWLVQLWHRPGLRPWLLVLLAHLLLLVAGAVDWLPDATAPLGQSHEPPSAPLSRWLGTDLLGRSVLWRIVEGGRTALTVGLLVALVAVPLGTLLGLAAGWYGGRVDAGITWLYTVVASVPEVLVATAIAYALGKGMTTICVALAATSWMGTMRLVRGEVLRQRTLGYVLGARAVGASSWRILMRHLLPNVMHLVLVMLTLVLVAAIKAEVVLTFLGMGIQEGTSWGLLITAWTPDLINGIWWPLAGTVLAMFLLIYSLSVVGDALRDLWDPKAEV